MAIRNEKLKKQLNAYKRSLEIEPVHTGMYVAVLFITVVIYGLTGLVPLVRTVMLKSSTVKELTSLNLDLEKKKDSLTQMELNMLSSKKYLFDLEKSVSRNPSVEEFMVSFVDTVGRSGYKQKNMSIQQGEDNRIIIRARLQGSASQLYSLVKSIENMQRLVVVDRMSYGVREGVADVTLDVTIFYAGT